MCRGGAGSPIEGKQKAFVPPPAGRAGRVPREVLRGKSCFPPAGFASRGGIASPLRETRRPPLGAFGALPPRFARLRGRELPRFCRLHHVGPLRPGIGTSCTKHKIPRFFASAFPGLLARHKESPASRPARVPRFESRLSCSARHVRGNSRSRPARVLFNRFSKNNPRAHTPVIADVPISNIRTRFCNTSKSHCILSFPPRPQKAGAGRGSIPVEGDRVPLSGRTFRIPFPSSGKVSPARGAQKQTIFAYKESEAKLQSPCGANNKQLLLLNRRTRSVQHKSHPPARGKMHPLTGSPSPYTPPAPRQRGAHHRLPRHCIPLPPFPPRGSRPHRSHR